MIIFGFAVTWIWILILCYLSDVEAKDFNQRIEILEIRAGIGKETD